MTHVSPSEESRTGPVGERAGRALAALLISGLAVQAIGVFRRNINWDEFLFLSNVYRVERGEPLGILQTAYVHLFGWLPSVGGTEISEIIVARALYLGLWGLSLFLLYRLGRRMLDPFGAFAGVVLFASFSYCLTHAVSFRIDGLLLPVLLGHLLLLTDPTPRRVLAAGGLFGLAMVFSIKAILWAPATALILLVWIRERRTTWPIAIGSAATALMTAGVLLVLHRAAMATGASTAGPAGVPVNPLANLAPIGAYMFLDEGFFPRLGVFGGAVVNNFATIWLMVSGAALAAIELRAPDRRVRALVLLALATPILAITFYANAWQYAYVTLIPTACLLAGFALSRFRQLGRIVLLVLIVGVAYPIPGALLALRNDGITPQREVVSTVHELFPEPVHYIDYTGMISSFPRRMFLMTRLGRRGYLERGAPLVANYIADYGPPLLIVNVPSLDVWEGGLAEGIAPNLKLLPADAKALRETYAPYWGRIYLAGKDWRGLKAAEALGFEIAIPGDYTVISDGSVRIDGETLDAGSTIALTEGHHVLEAIAPLGRVRLLWGKGLTIPASPPSPLPIYVPA